MLKNPVDVDFIRKSIETLDITEQPNGTTHFVACGRLEKQKGFDRLIKALKHFKPDCDWKLEILGEGTERIHLERLIKDNALEHRVFLKGLTLPPYSSMAQADCFLMPSLFEGLPNAVLESLACGTPVIATQESGGIREIAKDCPEDSVRVVENMNDFIKEMEKIKPLYKIKASPSLLAECYEQKTVINQLNNLLHGIYNQKSNT